MKRNASYPLILFRLTVTLWFAGVAALFAFACRIYPPFAFTGSFADLSSDGRQIAITVLVLSAAVLLLSFADSRLSRGPAVSSAVCALLCLTYSPQTRACYALAALLFAAVPITAAAGARNLGGAKLRQRKGFVYAAAIAISAMIVLSSSSAMIGYHTGASMLSALLMMYLPPIGATSAAVVLALGLRAGASRAVTDSLCAAACSGLLYAFIYPSSHMPAALCALSIAAATVPIALALREISRPKKQVKLIKEYVMENINKKIPGLGFHHVALRVKNFKKSYDFYTNVIGMTPLVGWGEQGSDKEVQMFDLGNGDVLEMFAAGGDELQAVGKWQHFAMTVDDVDQAYAAAIAGGAETHIAPKSVSLDSRPGKMTIRIAFVKGPDGEQLEFFKVVSKD